MTLSEKVLLAVLTLAAGIITYGVLLISIPVGIIVSGLLLATLAILFLTEVGG